MTSYLPPRSFSLPHLPAAQHDPGEAETSLDLAEVPDLERIPSILTRLSSDSPRSHTGFESPQKSPTAAVLPEEQHTSKSTNAFDIEAGPSRARQSETRHQRAMATGHQTGSRPRSPPTGNETEEDDIIDIGREGQSDAEGAQKTPHHTDTQNHQDTPERSRSPAYVAPIPKIGSIPPVSPGIQVSAPDRPELPAFVGSLLIGKLVDEDGDIVDEETGQVLAHAAGDLPSMMGRRVSNAQGDILGDEGELLGYVADIEWPRARPPPTSAPRSLADLMGRATSSLMVDHTGNILDASGNVVGKFHDNNNPLHRKEKEEKEARGRAQQLPGPKVESEKPGNGQQQRSPPPAPPTPSSPHGQEEENEEQEKPQSPPSTDESQRKPRRTEEERKKNAEEWRKENPNESPSDIFLDVKSTREGIQLTIRIPTVFNGQQTTPNISFS